MKRILFFISGLVLMASCQHDVVYEVDFNITLDKANTYYAGEPVRFNLAGEVDNVIFYSGETGHQYVYRNRYEVPLEAVKVKDGESVLNTNRGSIPVTVIAENEETALVMGDSLREGLKFKK